MTTHPLYGGIEGGGTKFICMVASDPKEIIDETRFLTTTPQETLQRVCDFFSPYTRDNRLDAIGLGTFGPLDIDPSSATYGYITTTPKPNWSDTDILGVLKHELSVPMAIDLDVVASALGEYRWGACQGADSALYLTVGTGIGGSFIRKGRPVRGLVSPEMGHIYIPHDMKHDPFPGSCPYHGDCFEGLANGPSISARFGNPPESLPDQDPFWELEAGYISSALVNYIMVLPPEKIVLGGGVMHRTFLYPKIRTRVSSLLNNYLNHPSLTGSLKDFIVPPTLGYRSGVLGAIVLAMNLEEASR